MSDRGGLPCPVDTMLWCRFLTTTITCLPKGDDFTMLDVRRLRLLRELAARRTVTAVGDELIIAHPTGSTDLPTAAVVLGGPALYLIGHALFKRAVFGLMSIPRVAAIVAQALDPERFLPQGRLRLPRVGVAVADLGPGREPRRGR